MAAVTLLSLGWGAVIRSQTYPEKPIRTWPTTMSEVIAQWPGISAEQIEQQVTIPLEIGMNGIPHLTHLRSFSIFGFSDLNFVFDDDEENSWNRERVLERLSK